LIVITGCAHPGIVEIVKNAKKIHNKNIYMVFGGFHLPQKSESEVKRIIEEFRELGVLKVGPTHCTGDKAIQLFKDSFGENYIKLGVGKVIEIGD
jgi:7,8-dihydropterin-6-yl-methyl-4-(beta-D-ribofuranosyl)aminobenzene 5'-phosphate synthase